jgi:hypothetical protein
MELPLDVLVIVGQYAVTNLVDLRTLTCAGLREALSHPRALAYVQLGHTRPEDLFELKCLTAKQLSGVRRLKFEFSGDGVDLRRLVQALPALRELDLGRTFLSTTDFLAGWPHLRTLRLTNCSTCSPFVGSLRSLDMLNCGPVAGDLGGLQTLKLHGCFITGITRMSPTLRSLDLRNAQWESVGAGASVGWTLDRLYELSSLRELRLFHCNSLQNDNAAGIRGMKGLHTLSLIECFNLSDFSFLQALPNLRSLTAPCNFDFSVLSYLDLESLTFPYVSMHTDNLAFNLSLIGSQTNLKLLSVGLGWHSSTHDTFDPSPVLYELLPKLPLLHTLDVPNWTTLQFLPVCPSVKQLMVDNCEGILDNELFMLGVSFPNLEALSVSRTGITDVGLAVLHSNLPHLKHLDISRCAVSEEGVKGLRRIAGLKSLDISECGVMPLLVPETVKLLGMNNFGVLDRASWSALQARGVELVDSRTFRAKLAAEAFQ